MIARKGLGHLLRLLQTSGLVGFLEKLAEIFGLNRLQNPDQRWVLGRLFTDNLDCRFNGTVERTWQG